MDNRGTSGGRVQNGRPRRKGKSRQCGPNAKQGLLPSRGERKIGKNGEDRRKSKTGSLPIVRPYLEFFPPAIGGKRKPRGQPRIIKKKNLDSNASAKLGRGQGSLRGKIKKKSIYRLSPTALTRQTIPTRDSQPGQGRGEKLREKTTRPAPY